MSNSYKRKKRGETGRHVQLPEWLQASWAWTTMKPGPRALYIELKRRFNGHNNGAIYLSHRDAAMALNVHRNTAGAWFRELENRGFIRLTIKPHLGPSGIGEASVWALEKLATKDGRLAGKTFMRWSKNQEPRTKTMQSSHKKQAVNSTTDIENHQAGTKPVTPSLKNQKGALQ